MNAKNKSGRSKNGLSAPRDLLSSKSRSAWSANVKITNARNRNALLRSENSKSSKKKSEKIGYVARKKERTNWRRSKSLESLS